MSRTGSGVHPDCITSGQTIESGAEVASHRQQRGVMDGGGDGRAATRGKPVLVSLPLTTSSGDITFVWSSNKLLTAIKHVTLSLESGFSEWLYRELCANTVRLKKKT